jgi:2'-5' RNA ligase
LNFSGCSVRSGIKTHKTAVVLIPSQEAWPSIQAIRRAHDRHYKRWMPHITLLYPFRPRSEFEPLAERFAQVCSRIPPFEVELGTWRWFRHRSSYTVWLAPEPEEALVRLQTALWQVVPDCDDVRRHAGGFTAHLSVGQVRGKDALDELLAELRGAWQPIRFWASKVSLIWRNGRTAGDSADDAFRVGLSIRLVGGNQ